MRRGHQAATLLNLAAGLIEQRTQRELAAVRRCRSSHVSAYGRTPSIATVDGRNTWLDNPQWTELARSPRNARVSTSVEATSVAPASLKSCVLSSASPGGAQRPTTMRR